MGYLVPWVPSLGSALKRKNHFAHLSGGPVDKNLPANAGEPGFDPCPKNIPGDAEQLSPCTATTEARVPRASAPQEKPPQWETPTPQLSSPNSPQIEKAHAQQRRPSATKNKNNL